MTPAQIETYCRRVTNKENDDFYSSTEIIESYLYDACLQVSELVPCVETKTDDTSVADQQAYDVPSTAIAVRRVEYDGDKLQKINMRQYDAIKLSNTLSTTSTGTPAYYYQFDGSIYLEPTPADAGDTISIYTWDRHPTVSSGSTLDIPAHWHMRLCDYVIAQMYFKDMDQRAQLYLQKWEQDKLNIQQEFYKAKYHDRFGLVMDEDQMPQTDYGMD